MFFFVFTIFRHSTTRNIPDGFETTIASHYQEPIVEERNSLAALKIFITHACEVLELWKILCENNLNNIVNCLSKVTEMCTISLFIMNPKICS